MIKEDKNLIFLEPLDDFVETEYVKKITDRAFHYIKAGLPVHFRGPAGTGKTTLAKHLASRIARPMMMIHGDDEFTTSSLIGGEYGYRSRTVIDNFISSVLKKEEDLVKHWVDNRLTVACKHGFTLIYDEFTRSRPEANNVLLSILEEKMLNLPVTRGGEDPYIQVHPDFVAIFTSNPEEYVGVHKTQDALRDRMITIDLDYFDYETELNIIKSKSGLSREESALIANIIRALRDSGECEFSPTIRAGIMIGKSIRQMGISPFSPDDNVFIEVCKDVLGSETSRVGTISSHHKSVRKLIEEIVEYQISMLKPGNTVIKKAV